MGDMDLDFDELFQTDGSNGNSPHRPSNRTRRDVVRA